MPIYNLIECNESYLKIPQSFLKISQSLWQYYRDEPNATLADSESFTSKAKIAGGTFPS